MNSLTAVGILANTAHILSVCLNCNLLNFSCEVKKQRTVMWRFELLVSRLCMLFQNPKFEARCKIFTPRRNRRCYTLYHLVEGNGFFNRVSRHRQNKWQGGASKLAPKRAALSRASGGGSGALLGLTLPFILSMTRVYNCGKASRARINNAKHSH
jgi:hypothetical protein